MLRADKGEQSAHFGKKAPEVLHQGESQFPLGMFIGQTEKIEGVMILYRQHGLRLDFGRQGLIEVGLVEQVFCVTLVVDLVLENGLGPAKASGGAKVELLFQYVFTASHDDEILGPTDFSNQWLEFWLALILGVELAHVPEVLRRETVATRELRLKVISERLHHGFTPTEYFLFLVNGLAKIPVERQ